MTDRRCPYCQQVFWPDPYHPQQLVCSQANCQRQHRRDYHRQKIASDPVYQQDLLGESSEVARGAPGLLEEISPGSSRAGGTKS
jgi:hypothetical protein